MDFTSGGRARKVCRTTERLPELDRWKLDPIQMDIMESMVIVMIGCLREVEGEQKAHSEILAAKPEAYLEYVKAKGKKYVGQNGVLHLKLNPAYKTDRIKLEGMVIPRAKSWTIWMGVILSFFKQIRAVSSKLASSPREIWSARFRPGLAQ